jgi:hypothetical protein
VYYYICVLILLANSTKALVARREVEEARAALEADRYDSTLLTYADVR